MNLIARITDVGQTISDDYIPSSHLYIPLLFHLLGTHSRSQHPQPFRFASTALQLEPATQRPHQYSGYTGQHIWSLGRR